MQPVPSTPTLWSDCEPWGPRCELHELHEETLLSGLAAACGVPTSAIALSHLDRGQARRTERAACFEASPQVRRRRGRAERHGHHRVGAPAPAAAAAAAAAEGFTGMFVAGDAAPTAGADAVGRSAGGPAGGRLSGPAGPFPDRRVGEIGRLARDQQLAAAERQHLAALEERGRGHGGRARANPSPPSLTLPDLTLTLTLTLT